MNQLSVSCLVLTRHVIPILVAILIIFSASVASPLNLPSAYTQKDTNYDFGEPNSDVISDDNTAESETEPDTSSNGSTSNETTDTVQSRSDESISDSGITDNQGNPNSSNDNLQTDSGQNSQPVADAGLDFEVDEKTNVVLDGRASSDQEGDISSYSWMQIDGYDKVELSSPDSVHPSFIAPSVDSNQQLSFQLTVSDVEGLTDTAAVNVLIRDIDSTRNTGNSQTQEPSLDLEKPSSSERSLSTDCTSNETDCTPGEVLPSRPIPIPPDTVCTDNQTNCNQIQPNPPSITECAGTESGCTSTEEPPVLCTDNNTNCNPVEQEPITGPCEGNDTSCIPTGEPLAPDCPDSMVGNMTGSSCNPPPEPVPNCPDNVGGNMTDNLTGIDCNPTPPVTCTDNETGCTSPVQEPPVICEGNETGCTSPGHCLDNMSLSIDCKNLENNVLPVANAGQDQVVNEGAQVILDGNNSYDTDGNITSYSWIQSSGEASVVLTDADMPSASFLAPQVDNNSTVSIELTVTDNFGTTNADQVNILIRNTNSTIIPPIEGKITLDNIPSLINAGSIFVFSGRLEISGVDGYNSSYVQIRSINNISDDILSYGVADNDGRYVMEWTAKPREMPYQVYAKYQDDFGNSLKSDDQSFKVNGTEFVYQNASALSLTQPYVALRFNNYNTKTLNVYVDATDKPSQPYVTTAIKAIKYWSQLLKNRSGNPNAWNFRIFSSNDFPSSMTSGYPINILINLEHNENSRECGSGWGGFTHTNLLDPLFRGQISARVFTGCGPQNWPEKAVFRITAHEFGHTLGLGHTWHEFDDMMCSSEYLRDFFIFNPRLVDTCNSPTDIYHDKTEPTEFDVRAVLYSYLNDGFQSPNRFGIPFVNGQYECQPLPCEPSQSSVEPKIVKPPVVKITNPKSPPIKSLIDENPEGKKKTTTVITTSKENKNSKPKILSDLSSYRLVTKLGSFGSGHGQFNHPAAISGDENGQRFYVADLDNNRIEVIHRGGNYITEWGTLGTGKGQFNGPGSIAVDNNHKLVFVSDIKNNRIEKFDTQGKYIGQWGKLGTANGQFDHPGDIALDPEKEILYVTDIYNNRIQAFYYDGNFINQWGSFGQQDGQFNRPAGITINTNYSLLYVSDTANNRIQMFDTDGKFVKEWGSLGIGNGQFARPDGIFFEPSEKAVYIADRQNSRIQVFDDQGAFITSWKVSSGINGVSIKPRDITMDPTGQLYIADKDNNNILVYNISASNASNELTSQSVKSNTDSSSRESSGSNNNKDSNGSTDKKKYLKAPSHRCDLSYPDFCIPSPPPDLDCPDISHKNFKVVGSDPHGFDRDGDGKGCESSSGTGVLDENPAKAEKGKIQVTYGDVSGYNGKANIQIKNLDTGKTLVNEKLNFGKQHASQGDHCCVKTYDFEWKGSSVGDHLGIKVTGGGGSWEDNSGYKLKKGTTKVSVSLDEIGE